MGLTTILLAGEQLTAGYLEGRYHAAYILCATSLFSPTNVLTYGWVISAVFFHFALCPKDWLSWKSVFSGMAPIPS